MAHVTRAIHFKKVLRGTPVTWSAPSRKINFAHREQASFTAKRAVQTHAVFSNEPHDCFPITTRDPRHRKASLGILFLQHSLERRGVEIVAERDNVTSAGDGRVGEGDTNRWRLGRIGEVGDPAGAFFEQRVRREEGASVPVWTHTDKYDIKTRELSGV